MKTTRLLPLLLSLLCGLYTYGQETTQDVIYVHDGSIYRGQIKSAPGEASYRIEIYGGTTISIRAADTDSIRREPAIVIRDRYTRRWIEPKSERYTRIDICGSLLMYAQQPRLPGVDPQYVYGGGLSFLPEFCKPRKNFSFLTGVAAQVMNTRRFSYQRSYDYINGTIDNGTHVRFEVPFWFRWSWGRRIGMFYQFGMSIGFNYYTGTGEEDSYQGHAGPNNIRYGRFTFYDAFINISPMAFGIRKELPSHVSLVAYLEGAPANLEFAGNVYMPYMQLHAGINFDPRYFMQRHLGRSAKTP